MYCEFVLLQYIICHDFIITMYCLYHISQFSWQHSCTCVCDYAWVDWVVTNTLKETTISIQDWGWTTKTEQGNVQQTTSRHRGSPKMSAELGILSNYVSGRSDTSQNQSQCSQCVTVRLSHHSLASAPDTPSQEVISVLDSFEHSAIPRLCMLLVYARNGCTIHVRKRMIFFSWILQLAITVVVNVCESYNGVCVPS